MPTHREEPWESDRRALARQGWEARGQESGAQRRRRVQAVRDAFALGVAVGFVGGMLLLAVLVSASPAH